VNIDAGIGLSTKENPQKTTKGSLKFKGVVHLINEGDMVIANIKNN
jgi:hypothetical protein